MTNSDFIGLAASYADATGLLVFATALRRLFGLQPGLTRKLIHVSAGMWVFGVLTLFNRW
jgi:phytol kinase